MACRTSFEVMAVYYACQGGGGGGGGGGVCSLLSLLSRQGLKCLISTSQSMEPSNTCIHLNLSNTHLNISIPQSSDVSACLPQGDTKLKLKNDKW